MSPIVGSVTRVRRRSAAAAAVAAAAAALLVTLGSSPGDKVRAAVPEQSAARGVSVATVPSRATARLLFAGDVMLGRGVASFAASDPEGLLDGVRSVVSAADLAAANLESPFTKRAHDPMSGPNALEAPPASARLLAHAGFDAMGIANNHAGDAGPRTVPDTLAALSRAGIVAVGGGLSATSAYAPKVVDLGRVRVALLAFDATGKGPRAGRRAPGVAPWDEALSRRAVSRARSTADIVAVGLHGGSEYMSATDPYVMRIGKKLADWGADVVWGQGAHVVQPIRVIRRANAGRPTIVATSLGNLLFDQHIPGTQRGAVLEVLVAGDGVRAFRIGAVHAFPPAAFVGWRPPQGDAVAIDGEWWTFARHVERGTKEQPPSLAGFDGDVVDAALGDALGNGGTQLVVAFRRPFEPTLAGTLVPRRQLVDRQGRTAHVGVYRRTDLQPVWVAGTLFRPVAAVAACDGAIAVAYSTLDGEAIVSTGAWLWGGFGFLTLPELPGAGSASCANVSGRLDPVVLERSSR